MKNITDWFVVINTFLLMLYKTITNRFINFNQKIASSQLDNIIMVTNKGQLTNSLTLTVGQQAILIVLSNVKLIA